MFIIQIRFCIFLHPHLNNHTFCLTVEPWTENALLQKSICKEWYLFVAENSWIRGQFHKSWKSGILISNYSLRLCQTLRPPKASQKLGTTHCIVRSTLMKLIPKSPWLNPIVTIPSQIIYPSSFLLWCNLSFSTIILIINFCGYLEKIITC